MFRTPARATIALVIGLVMAQSPVAAQTPAYTPTDAALQRYSAEQLDNLVSPIALYPDPLLAQVLVAATFPDQVEEAAAWVRANGTADLDEMGWDVSVRSIAHYPSALNMMGDQIDWTATLGRAYAYQSTDVMLAVQRMRALADSHGNLVSTEQQQVFQEDNNYIIVPAQPQVIYVPVYDPWAIYYRPVFGSMFSSRYWSFGIGFPIGSWLMYDMDWRMRSVFYHGWNHAHFGYGGGWRARSFPFININTFYVSPRYTNVYVNRTVHQRPIDYGKVDRYARVHRDVSFAQRGSNEAARSARAGAVTRTVERAADQRLEAQRNARINAAVSTQARATAASSSEPTRLFVERRARDASETTGRSADVRSSAVRTAVVRSGASSTQRQSVVRQAEAAAPAANTRAQVIRSSARPVTGTALTGQPLRGTPVTTSRQSVQRAPGSAQQAPSTLQRVPRSVESASGAVQRSAPTVLRPQQRTQPRAQTQQRIVQQRAVQPQTSVQQRTVQPQSQQRSVQQRSAQPQVQRSAPQRSVQQRTVQPQRSAPAPAPRAKAAPRPSTSPSAQPSRIGSGSGSGGLRGTPIRRN